MQHVTATLAGGSRKFTCCIFFKVIHQSTLTSRHLFLVTMTPGRHFIGHPTFQSSMLARVVCTCQVGFHLKFLLSSKLSALKTTYQFQNIIRCLSSISVTNGSIYNSRKWQFSAVEHSMCDDHFVFVLIVFC